MWVAGPTTFSPTKRVRKLSWRWWWWWWGGGIGVKMGKDETKLDDTVCSTVVFVVQIRRGA
jgi:hypothetical protein